MIEKEIQLLFLSEISIYLCQFFFSYVNDFLMVWDQGTFQILSSIDFESVKGQKQKIILGHLFSFSKFSSVWKFGDSFWSQLKQIFRMSY